MISLFPFHDIRYKGHSKIRPNIYEKFAQKVFPNFSQKLTTLSQTSKMELFAELVNS